MKKSLQVFVCLAFLFLSSQGFAAMKKALIFGVTGQDGTYLAKFLLKKNYEVHGVKRRSSLPPTGHIDLFYDEIHKSNSHFILHYGDITDHATVMNIISSVMPDEIYNLASESYVKRSFDMPERAAEIDGLGPLYILKAIRALKLEKKVRFYQASSSEMYGQALEVPQTEQTPFSPRSPYAVAKAYGFWITKNYREAYNIFACNGILFNHESPLRCEDFVSRKITLTVARQQEGLADILYLGALDVKRDWGYAKEYVEAMWRMLQQDVADDYVVATGVAHSVREFVELAYQEVGITLRWQGQGAEECGVDAASGRVLVKIDPSLYRPTEVRHLCGNPHKARAVLHWRSRIDFSHLVKLMMEADKKVAAREKKNAR